LNGPCGATPSSMWNDYVDDYDYNERLDYDNGLPLDFDLNPRRSSANPAYMYTKANSYDNLSRPHLMALTTMTTTTTTIQSSSSSLSSSLGEGENWMPLETRTLINETRTKHAQQLERLILKKALKQLPPQLRTVRLRTLQEAPFVIPALLATKKRVSDFNPCWARLLRDKNLSNKVLGDSLAILDRYAWVWSERIRYSRYRLPWYDRDALDEFTSQLANVKFLLQTQGRGFQLTDTWEHVEDEAELLYQEFFSIQRAMRTCLR
jgi:hypothetical protein